MSRNTSFFLNSSESQSRQLVLVNLLNNPFKGNWKERLLKVFLVKKEDMVLKRCGFGDSKSYAWAWEAIEFDFAYDLRFFREDGTSVQFFYPFRADVIERFGWDENEKDRFQRLHHGFEESLRMIFKFTRKCYAREHGIRILMRKFLSEYIDMDVTVLEGNVMDTHKCTVCDSPIEETAIDKLGRKKKSLKKYCNKYCYNTVQMERRDIKKMENLCKKIDVERVVKDVHMSR